MSLNDYHERCLELEVKIEKITEHYSKYIENLNKDDITEFDQTIIDSFLLSIKGMQEEKADLEKKIIKKEKNIVKFSDSNTICVYNEINYDEKDDIY
jgi:hypothetical protein